ncbi:hypothetical protein [Pseudoalteromonas sp. BDTF-M6]|uniref:hypothetical protein n=1 Tax=Pseudoalteromonas sp. BDTF-M6 TaxID=2796132 RepID=UPI001BAE77FE|nr:hypothetical protein [Pseudoalteromonas sp. BDTF-M6]MBS3796362.1 hypothetical protein [Pseudoalteromonas sp. BDTF-M6]
MRRQRIQPPALNNVQASPMSDNFWFYADINLPLNYCGTLIIDRMPMISGDESELYIREAIKNIVESGSHITRWTLQFVVGQLITETAHEPDERLAELIECYGEQEPLELNAVIPVEVKNTRGLNMDLASAASSNALPLNDNVLFNDFEIEPPQTTKNNIF